ncbi:ferric reductase-like transmembrane domain-containing protein [Actinomycetaceae bacterium TAE3-ERU4]|nr:ferric reductase-like transmembrane domain-containing protein [Actinomycetaceae bacterium TAE3-ERU4]
MLAFLYFLYVENLVLLGFGIVTPLVFLLRKNIRAHALWYYLGSTFLSFLIIGLFVRWALSDSYPNEAWWWPLISQVERGSVGFVLFTIVMFQGVIKPWNRPTKQLYAIRGELSILACILTFPHITIYFLGYLFVSSRSDWGYEILMWSSMALLVIAIPLFYTSFKKIRFSMSALKWQKLHKLSYVFYFVLYANVILVFVRRIVSFSQYLDKDFLYMIDTYLSLAIYTGIFIAYTILRIRTSLDKRERARIRELKRQAHIQGRPLESPI